jgi:single-strand DNA-binding protein
MNKVMLVGRLTRDPDFKTTQNSSYCRFSIAVDRRFKQDGQPEADFPSIVAWGKTAEFVDKYFHKGMKIGIEGRIQTGSYQNREGQTVYTTDVVAEAVEFVESKNSSQNSGNGSNGSHTQSQTPPQTTDDGWMNIPEGSEEELPFN